jgi:hypothetical protein
VFEIYFLSNTQKLTCLLFVLVYVNLKIRINTENIYEKVIVLKPGMLFNMKQNNCLNSIKKHIVDCLYRFVLSSLFLITFVNYLCRDLALLLICNENERLLATL